MYFLYNYLSFAIRINVKIYNIYIHSNLIFNN